MATTRFRAKIDVGHDNPDLDFRGALKSTRAAAIKEAVDHILETGVVTVDEVEVVRKTRTTYEEKA